MNGCQFAYKKLDEGLAYLICCVEVDLNLLETIFRNDASVSKLHVKPGQSVYMTAFLPSKLQTA